MSGKAVSEAVKQAVKDKTGKDVNFEIEKLSAIVEEERIKIDFDVPFFDVNIVGFSLFNNIVKCLAAGAAKLFTGKIISIANDKLNNLKIKNQSLDIEVTALRFDTLKLTSGNGVEMKGEAEMKSGNLSAVLSCVISDVLSEKAGLDVKIQSIVFDKLSVDILENGCISLKFDADFTAENPAIIGEIDVKDGVLSKFFAKKIIAAIKKKMNADISLNINEMKITAVSGSAEVKLSGSAEIGDEAAAAIIEKAYKKKNTPQQVGI